MTELKKFNKSVPKKKAQEILTAVKNNGWNKTEYQKEQNESVISFITSLEHLESQIIGLDQVLDELIEATGYPLKTINGVDTVLAATFIANIGDITRFPRQTKLAKLAGIAPLEHSSGESQRNYSNKLGNRKLNKAFYCLALTQIRKDMNPIMHEYYQNKIKEGSKKKQAMIYVERRLVNIVFSIMKNKTPYKQLVLEDESA